MISIQTTLGELFDLHTPCSQTKPSKRPGKRSDTYVNLLMWALSGPIIVWPQYENMPIPDKVKSEISIYRLCQAMQDNPLATEAETMWYLSTASLTAPMNSDWAKVFTYLCTRHLDRCGNSVPGDVRTDTLSEQQRDLMNSLQSWLYKKAFQATKKKLKQNSPSN